MSSDDENYNKFNALEALVQQALINLSEEERQKGQEELVPRELDSTYASSEDSKYTELLQSTESSDHQYRAYLDGIAAVEYTSIQPGDHYVNNNNNQQFWKVEATYHNPLLNHKDLLSKAYKLFGIKGVNSILELGEDKGVAEQILLAANEIGTEKVLEILFNPIKAADTKITTAPDNKILETMAEIEAIIGKESLTEITGYYQYISTALSNNQLSASATKAIKIIGNLVNNLEECLDFSALYENVDINNQVAIILTQLENWFDFVASGPMNIGLPPRHHGSDPGDDYNGGSGSGQGLIYGGGVDGNQNSSVVTFFVGQNTTSMLDS